VKKVCRRICGPKKEQARGGQINLHKKELQYSLYSSPEISNQLHGAILLVLLIVTQSPGQCRPEPEPRTAIHWKQCTRAMIAARCNWHLEFYSVGFYIYT
jgi:hypothetical protein